MKIYRPCLEVIFGAAALALLLCPPLASAAPTEVHLRIEGRTQTLFEGPVLSQGHLIKASSDSSWRRCDATNGAASSTPGPTPTGVADDAMRISRHDFDGQWNAGFDDYFIQRFGPDRESVDANEYWGVLVNGVFSSVGGCQLRLESGDHTLWVYNAFKNRPMLRLSADTGDGRIPNPAQPWLPTEAVVRVSPGEPFTLRVESYTGGMDGAGQNVKVEPDLAVAPVATAANGFQTVSGTPIGTTDSSGELTHSLGIPGWHRFKVESEERFVRSNRLDICVEPCPPPPPDVAVRIPPPPANDPGTPPTPAPPSSGGQDQPDGNRAGPRLTRPRFVTGPNRRGRIGLRWTVQDPGVGLRGWRVESRRLAAARARWVTRARGGPARRSAAFRLPAGSSHLVRFTVVDNLGRSASVVVGRAFSLIDERHPRVRLRGSWRPQRNRNAWRGMTARGGRGATLRVLLPAGRPVVVLRSGRRQAKIRIEAEGRTKVYTIAGRRGAESWLVTAPRRRKPGPVTVRVLGGRVELDGLTTR